MFSGFYSIASGVLVNQKTIDTISNNLVNAQTPGYRAESVTHSAFEQELMARSDSSGSTILGDGIISPYTVINGVQTTFTSGQLKDTGRSLDVALEGDGFFNIKGSDGNTYLTRSGSFSIDGEGYLVLPGAGRVQGENGDIQVKSSDITVSSDGTVESSSGQALGKILVTTTADLTTLQKAGNGLYTSSAAMNASDNCRLFQNKLELSNVDVNVELTNLMATQRALQNCASALKTIDSLDQKASAQIAAV
jgi:flagellar basal-body rod protein FlgF